MKMSSSGRMGSSLASLRFPRMDGAILVGWLGLMALGQWVWPRESSALEAIASLWIWMGMLLVRRVWCIPLMVLAYPVFLCENHRSWAWVLPVLAGVCLVRMLLENRFTGRQYAAILGTAIGVLLLSWPDDAGRLISEYAAFSGREIFQQWLRPSATWAVFPFRSALDRAWIAAICAAAIVSGRYFSARRVWTALWLAALWAILGAYGPVLLPWQQGHLFLGTGNSGAYGSHLFHGAGYNIHYFVALLGCGLPFFFVPIRDRWLPLRLGSVALLPPVLLIQQRGLCLAIMALVVLAALAGVAMLALQRQRAGARRRWRRLNGRDAIGIAASLVVGLGLLGLWGAKLGIQNPRSELNRQVRIRVWTFFALDDLTAIGFHMTPGGKREAQANTPAPVSPSVIAPGVTAAAGGTPRAGPAGTGSIPAKIGPGWRERLERRLAALDSARGPMWSLGMREILKAHLWIGSGAGTWARFHRSQPRPERIYFAHMHNVYLDLMFEHGLAFFLLLLALAGVGAIRILAGRAASRVWLFPLAALAVLGLGQHFFFAFSSQVLLMPVLIVLARSARGAWRRGVRG